jgi:hypothetical protein
MIARRLNEQEPPGELPAEAQPVVPDAAPPVADPPVEPETVDELRAAYARVRADNLTMAARLAALEAPPVERWVEIKRAARSSSKSDCEWLRRLAKAEKVEAKKEGGFWLVDENGPKLKAWLKRPLAK